MEEQENKFNELVSITKGELLFLIGLSRVGVNYTYNQKGVKTYKDKETVDKLNSQIQELSDKHLK